MKRAAEDGDPTSSPQSSEKRQKSGAEQTSKTHLPFGLYLENGIFYTYNQCYLQQAENQINTLIKYDPLQSKLNLDPTNPDDFKNVQNAFIILNNVRYGVVVYNKPYESYLLGKTFRWLTTSYSNFCNPQYELMKKFYQIVLLASQVLAASTQPPLEKQVENERNKTLYNFGSTCYLNATLQCLSNVRSLNQYLIDNTKEASALRQQFLDDPVAKEYISFLHQLKRGADHFKPILLKNIVINTLFNKSTGQQDAHELSTGLLQSLIKHPEHNPFKIKLEKILTCPNCNHIGLISREKDAENMLSIEIPNPKDGGEKTLNRCISDFTQEKKLSVDNMWRCPNCNHMVQAKEQLKLLNLPQNLIIHLKRFSNRRQKKETAIKCPFQDFNIIEQLSERCDPESFSLNTYDLTGFICHRGGYGSGHYICYVKDCITEKWYKYDDTDVEKKTDNQIRQIIETDGRDKTFQPYILFYQQKTS